MITTKSLYYAICGIFAAVGTAIAESFGGWDAALQTLVAFMAIDYIAGVVCALIWKKSTKSDDGAFESKASIKGLFRKMAYFACVYMSARLDSLIGTGNICRTATIFFFIANDGFSIIENTGLMGVPWPPIVKNAFEVLKKKGGAKLAGFNEGETL